MDIDDFLKKPEFRDLNEFLTNEMYEKAGEQLVKRMYEVFEDKNDARSWFYSNIIALGSERPYDFCVAGKHQEVKDVLGRIDYGVFS